MSPHTSGSSYPSGLLRISLSSIPYPSHLNFTINDLPLDLSPGFPSDWSGSKDRRWVEMSLSELATGMIRISVSLTKIGQEEEEGQGGKMITSLEVMSYGPPDRSAAFAS